MDLLPDDVVREILSRVKAHDVLSCREVCPRWRDLISTQNFKEMHVKSKAHHSSMFLVRKTWFPMKVGGELLLLDKWEQPEKRPKILSLRPDFMDNPRARSIVFQLSFDGLMVMESIKNMAGISDYTILIGNPISREEVRIKSLNSEFQVYAMFFNQFVKEYCLLLGKYGADSYLEFQMLNLGAKPCCRTLKQPASLLHKPRWPGNEPPVVIDDTTIYWLVANEYDRHHFPGCEEMIMAFDIKTEKFTFMPHPIDDCPGSSKHEEMHIVKIDGRLSFVQCTTTPGGTSFMINIWTLKESTSRLWEKSIDALNINTSRLIENPEFKVMAVENGELLMHYSHERAYAYNLELGTLRRIGKTYKNSNISIYVPSFVSLGHCKSEIWI